MKELDPQFSAIMSKKTLLYLLFSEAYSDSGGFCLYKSRMNRKLSHAEWGMVKPIGEVLTLKWAILFSLFVCLPILTIQRNNNVETINSFYRKGNKDPEKLLINR